MSTLTIEGWCKTGSEQKSTPLEDIHFYLNGTDHLHLEQAEEYLQRTHEPDVMVDVDMTTLDLNLPAGCGPLSDCRMRVYLDESQRGQFHLVGHRASDGSLIYTNAVLIDQLI
ncbi:hypothetical protein [Pseudomonas panipatensis]|jgi:hypothetical protein|uniref:Uncharacterized protein n=1 Tax=Pseudomonas panipatensis TaxID=428992 RepID=A0A1G8LBF4_9PSED|nr:hypothetical protein [Pseudomonas panipatensis]SDI52570.1 hypothetical protein SAMN05216272_11144 [Pseudomonas panipatensis]SMP75314.1 hypothetical protein SAMN06295951_113156 [Pseudomonas panipatensis]